MDTDFRKCFIKYIYKVTRKENKREMFKYFMPKKWYTLFEYATVTGYNIVFYTLNIDYKEIWSVLRQADKYGESQLIYCGFSDEYNCYIVEVQAEELLGRLEVLNDNAWNEMMKNEDG